MTLVIAAIALNCALFACLGSWVSDQKGRAPAEGAILGALFSAFGVLIAALLPTQEDRP